MRSLLFVSLLLSGLAQAAPRFDDLIDAVARQARSGRIGEVSVTAGRASLPRSGELGRAHILTFSLAGLGPRKASRFSIAVGGARERGGRRLIFALGSHPHLPGSAERRIAAGQADRVNARGRAVLDSSGAKPSPLSFRGSAPSRGPVDAMTGGAVHEYVEIVLSQTEALNLDLGAIEEIVRVVSRTR